MPVNMKSLRSDPTKSNDDVQDNDYAITTSLAGKGYLLDEVDTARTASSTDCRACITAGNKASLSCSHVVCMVYLSVAGQ